VFSVIYFAGFGTINPKLTHSHNLDFGATAVLASKAPSTLDALAWARRNKEQRRVNTGSRSGFGRSQIAALARNDLPLPPLQGTVPKFVPNREQTNVEDPLVTPHSKENQPPIAADLEEFSGDSSTEEEDLGTMAKDSKTTSIKKAELQRLRKKLAEQEKAIEDMKMKASAKKKRMKKGGKNNRSDEQATDVQDAIKEYVKDVLFRNVKFAQLENNELEKATIKVWNGIKEHLKLEEGTSPLNQADFVEIYDTCVLTNLSVRRQYTQTRGHSAAKGTYFVYWLAQSA
jgi:hypothetical protein